MFNSLRVKILLLVVLLLLGSTATILFYVSGYVEKTLTLQHEKEANNLIESVSQHVEIEYNSILFHKKATLTGRKENLKNIIDLAFAVINSFHDLYETGILSEAEARKQAMETLRAMRYGKDDVGYIWLNNTDQTMPTLDMHPVLPELENKPLTEDRYYSAHGMTEHLLRAFVDICERQGAGYVDYLWPKPLHNGVTEDRPKLSYVKLFRPWDWVVGTGVYIDDIDAAAEKRITAVKQELREILGKLDLGPNGYMYIFDGSSKIIVHPNLTGQYLRDIINPATSNDFFSDLAGSVSNNNGVLVYNWNKPNEDLDDKSYEKHCYTHYFEPLDWYISATYYRDEILQPVREIKRNMVVVASSFLVVALLLSVLLSRSLAAPLQRLAATAANIEKDGIRDVKVPISGTNETRELGLVLASMLASIREREQQLQGIAETVPGAIYQLHKTDDHNFSFTYISEKAVTLFGIPRHQQISFDNILAKIQDKDKATLISSLTDAFAHETPWFFEARITVDGGTIRWIQGRGDPVRQDGDVVLNGILLDITEQTQTQIQLMQSRKMESVGQLAGGIAHDFNNMLSVILGFSEMLQDELDPQSEAAEFVQSIFTAAQSASNLTGKLLTFSRQGKNLSTSIDMHDVIGNATQLLKRSIDKRIEIKNELHASPASLIGDPAELQNMFLNLGLNARDAMPDGGTLTVTTSNVELDPAFCEACRFDVEPGAYIQVDVADTGSGIPDDIQENIFEPFITTKEVGKGTGLGLAAVYGCIKDHGGAIALQSEVGKGTVFRLYFPVDTSDSQTHEPDATKVPSERNFQGEGAVLIIEDEPEVRSLAERLFKKLGFSVITAVDGEDGIQTYRQHHNKIDLVVLDMVMPKCSGKDCYYAIREINPEAKVLLSSGFTRNQSVSTLIKDGAVGFIKKPYSHANLCEALNAIFPPSQPVA